LRQKVANADLLPWWVAESLRDITGQTFDPTNKNGSRSGLEHPTDASAILYEGGQLNAGSVPMAANPCHRAVL
jgi:hypothetical protein